ncbi:flippase-like domain-containing protein [Myxococcota bacterium]|nr:flippase-like domain-containing protein [Myxococcota bacterium]MBU1381227.1 flippase-like domain-containing protein [Myxococcota bacterium]MBU1496927.1 flippase-like domain-containing protein [Myxococcota bacterium]
MSESSGKSSRRIFLFILLFIIIYVLMTLWAGYDNILKAFSSVPLYTFAVGISLASLNYVFRYIRWVLLLKTGDISISNGKNMLIFLSGFSLTMTPGKVGEAVKSVLLAREGIAIEKTLGIVIYERLSDLAAVTLLALSGFIFYRKGFSVIAAAISIVGILLFILSSELIRNWFLDLLRKVKVPPVILEKISGLIVHTQKYLTLKTHIRTLPWAVAGWAAEGIAFFVIVRILGIPLGVFEGIFVFSVSTLAGVLFPGGLGGMEGMMLFLLRSRADAGLLVISIFILRICTLWWATLCGIVALFFLKLIGKKQKIIEN